jgi:hypothetical protein
MATAFQLTFYPPISVARKLLVNAFDELTQLLVLVVTTVSMLFVRFVVKTCWRVGPLLGRLSKLIPVLGGDYRCIGVFPPLNPGLQFF